MNLKSAWRWEGERAKGGVYDKTHKTTKHQNNQEKGREITYEDTLRGKGIVVLVFANCTWLAEEHTHHWDRLDYYSGHE